MQKNAFKPNDAYNEAKACNQNHLNFLCIATVDVWHRPALQHSLAHSYFWLGLYEVDIKPGFNLASSTTMGYITPSSDISKNWLGLIHL